MIEYANAIEISGLSVAYRDHLVLSGVDLTIPSKVVMGLIGPNGAGKSTLLKSILDLVPRVSGQISILGQPYSADRSRIAYVPQRSAIDWDFPTTVLDLVLMGTYGSLGWIRRPGKKERDAAAAAIDRLGISDLENRPIGQLSGGQQQRAFLARAFVQDSPIYFLDEPFVGVDMLTEELIVHFLHELRDEGKTIVVVQHDLSTVGQYLDQLTLINRQIIACGVTKDVFTPERIKQTYGHSIQRIEFGA